MSISIHKECKNGNWHRKVYEQSRYDNDERETGLGKITSFDAFLLNEKAKKY